MENNINISLNGGYIDHKELLISPEEANNLKPNEVTILCTGSQGEPLAALSRIANGNDRNITLMPNDTVIFSSSPIPGNEKQVFKVINELSIKGAKVIFQDTHVSGHACAEEIKLMYTLVRPKYAIPVHGEFRHRMRQGELAQSMGIDKDNVFILAVVKASASVTVVDFCRFEFFCVCGGKYFGLLLRNDRVFADSFYFRINIAFVIFIPNFII